MLQELLRNHLLINALLAWATAQILKFIIYLAVNRTLDWDRLLGDGGMPSGHSATVTALAVTAGIEYGCDSPVFAVCVQYNPVSNLRAYIPYYHRRASLYQGVRSPVFFLRKFFRLPVLYSSNKV